MPRRSVPKTWMRTPDDEAAVAEGCWFDPAAGELVCGFFRDLLTHAVGAHAGHPFALLPWQRDLVMRLYGWRRPDGRRRFREAYVEIPKKQGKSTLVAGLELYHLVADGEFGAEVYTGARDRQQAQAVFKVAMALAQASPYLAPPELEIIPSAKRLVHPATNSLLMALSADVGSKEGLDASFACIDELHVQATPALYHTLRYAGAARRNPLFLAITTAGEDRESICYAVHETARQIADGTLSDTPFLGIIYAADPADDFEDPTVWRKANPSMGHTIDEGDFARELKAAQRSPGDWAQFLRYRLNLWIAVGTRFLNRIAWDACTKGRIDPETLRGQPCDAGLDLSSTTDLSALSALFDDDRVLCRAWTPEATILERSRRDRVDYRGWIDREWLIGTPGPAIDYDRIRDDVVAFHRAHPIRTLYADPWNATQLLQQLRNEGIKVVEIRQGFREQNAPTKELERLVLTGALDHGGNPVLTWNADNAIAITDAAGNLKLDKKTSRQRIDLLAALVNATAGRIARSAVADSVYERRGVLRFPTDAPEAGE
jgi:phage terminase large subunit-like protein